MHIIETGLGRAAITILDSQPILHSEAEAFATIHGVCAMQAAYLDAYNNGGEVVAKEYCSLCSTLFEMRIKII